MTQDIEENSEPLLIVEYSLGGRILALIYISISLILLVSAISVVNLFFQIFIILILMYMAWVYIRIMFLSKLIFNENELLLEWNILGYWNIIKMFPYQFLVVGFRKRLFGGGNITFITTEKRWQYPIYIDLMPINKNDLIKIKEILTKENVIKGDDM